MSVDLIWLFLVIYMCYFLPIDQQIANEGGFCCQSWLLLSCIFQWWCRSKFGKWTLYNSLTSSKDCDINEMISLIRNLW